MKIEVKPPSPWAGVLSSLVYLLPLLVMAGVLWFIFRQAQGSNNAAMSFGKSRARMFSGDQPTVTFEDVAGVDESKEELKEVVELLDKNGYAVGNVDATLSMEAPKINPHIEVMQAVIAPILKVTKNEISIKATTNEKLGYVGREEGVNAYAVALIYKK